MKALTLYQPWASFVACGLKKWETRSWATEYRGPLAIHSALRPVDGFLSTVEKNIPKDLLPRGYPLGCVLAEVELVEIYPTDFQEVSETERLLGDWRPGRFAWQLKLSYAVNVPWHARGGRGLWNLLPERSGLLLEIDLSKLQI